MLLIEPRTPTSRDDAGSTLVAVLIVMLVLTIGGLTLGAVVVNTSGMLVSSADRTKAQAAVDAGIAAQTARLESGAQECKTTSGSDAIDGASSPRYDFELVCGGGVATLTAQATVGKATTSRQVVFTLAEDSAPPTAGGPGLFYTYSMATRLNSFVFDDANSELGIDDFAGSAGVYASLGTIQCGTGSILPSDVYTKTGDLKVEAGCVIRGSAYIGGQAVNRGIIEGNLIAPKVTDHTLAGTFGTAGGGEGNVFVGGTFTLESGTVHGSATAAGTGKSTLGSGTIRGNFRYRGSYGVWGTPATTIVKGGIVRDGSMTAPTLPEIPAWQDVTFVPVNATTPPKAWADEGWKLTTVTGTACTKWSGNAADVTSLASTLTSKTIFDIRACSGAFDTNAGGANKEVKVNRDIAIITNKWKLSGTKFKSADGNPHTIFLITPDGNSASPGPQCNAPAQGSEQLNDSTVDPKLAVYMYTPCKMWFNSGSATFRGQVYAGGLEFGGGVKVAFAPRNIPGYDFGKDVEPWPGGGGTASSLVLTLISSRDIPPSP